MARPLRVLVTRTKHQASALAGELRSLGIEPILVPAIELAPPVSFVPLDAAIASLRSFDWAIFTSANAVEVATLRGFAEALDEAGRPRIAAIGPATARALEAASVPVDLLPKTAVAEALAETLRPFAAPGTQFLLIRAEKGREVLPQSLRGAGAEVVIAPAYRNVVPRESLEQVREIFADAASVDAVTFTSSSSVTNLLGLLDEAGVSLPDSVRRISMGPVTSATLREAGLPPHAEAREATVRELAAACVDCLL